MLKSKQRRHLHLDYSLRLTAAVLVFCFVLGLVIAAIRILSDQTPPRSSSVLEFSFPRSGEGRTPAGTRFDVELLTSDEVIAAGLSRAGLEGRYSVDEVRACLFVDPFYTKDYLERFADFDSLLDFSTEVDVNLTAHQPTQFTVILYDQFGNPASKGELNALLNGIMAAFRDSFIENYHLAYTGGDLFENVSDYDYDQQLSAIRSVLSETASYASALYQNAPSFRYQGSTFNDIVLRLNSLMDTNISSMEADITLNGLTKNLERKKANLEYTLVVLNFRKEAQEELEQKVSAIVTAYEKSQIFYLTNQESFTKINANSSAAYDRLVSAQKSISENITSLKAQISEYEMRLSDLLQYRTAPSVEKARLQLLQDNTEYMLEKQDRIIADFRAMLEAYNAQMFDESTIMATDAKYTTRSLLSGAYIVQVIKTAGPLCALGLIVCLVRIFVLKRKKARSAV